MASNEVHIKKRASQLSEKKFPFEIVHMGEPANNMKTFHWHEFYEISHVREGEGIYEIEGKTFPVEKGDIIIINNIERHKVSYNKEKPLYQTVIHFEPNFIWSGDKGSFDYEYLKLFLYNGASFINKPELDCDTSKAVTQLIEAIVQEYKEKKPYYELMIKSKLMSLITYLIRQCDFKKSTEYELLARRQNIERLGKIIKYINENYNKDIGLSSIAQHFFMNPSYFSDYFKKNLGINFYEYLTNVRINEAMRLLSFNCSTMEAAFKSGFNNISSFCSAFKKRTGMSPKQYKNSKKR